MVRDDAERHIGFLLLGVASAAGFRERRAVALAAEFFDGVKDRTEDVGLVVGNLGVLEISQSLRALNDAGDALETHAGVHVLRRQRDERAVRVRVKLDEDVVPDFDATGVAFVDELTAGVAVGREVHVDFGAGTARAGFAHHPEIVLLVAGDDVDARIATDGGEFLRPIHRGFLIGDLERRGVRIRRDVGRGRHRQRENLFEFNGPLLFPTGFAKIRTEDGGVEALRRKLPDFDDEFPRPINGFALEIIAEGPVAEHLEERVVIGIETDVVEVIVFAAGADALLGVRRATRRVGALGLAEEDGHELVHAGIREQQVGRVRHQRGRGNDGVLLRLEEVEERLADFS